LRLIWKIIHAFFGSKKIIRSHASGPFLARSMILRLSYSSTMNNTLAALNHSFNSTQPTVKLRFPTLLSLVSVAWRRDVPSSPFHVTYQWDLILNDVAKISVGGVIVNAGMWGSTGLSVGKSTRTSVLLVHAASVCSESAPLPHTPLVMTHTIVIAAVFRHSGLRARKEMIITVALLFAELLNGISCLTCGIQRCIQVFLQVCPWWTE
jgi:hypothetical protein